MLKKINIIKLIIPIISILIITAITGCSSNSNPTNPSNNTPTPTPMAGSSAVIMQSDAFSPSTITISKGTTVTWTNNDTVLHNVISGVPGAITGLFGSGNLAKGDTFSFTFNTAGTFQYFCGIHQDIMKGQVIVQ